MSIYSIEGSKMKTTTKVVYAMAASLALLFMSPINAVGGQATSIANAGKLAGGAPGLQKAAPGVLKAGDHIPDQYIVIFKDTAVGSQSGYSTGQVAADVAALADTVAYRYGATVDKTWSVAIKGMVVRMSLKQAEIMAKDSSVALVEQD
jgi:hypothetical protein